MIKHSPETSLPLLWLRAETKAFEQRTLLTPDIAEQLIAHGYELVVERCEQRIFNDSEFELVGCSMADTHAWHDAPRDAIILGLKELDVVDGPFYRRHVHFAHVFKDQKGWQDTLLQFRDAGGSLYDLEYLIDENNKRVAAFGYWAGFVGAAVAILAFCAKQRGSSLGPLCSWANKNELVTAVESSLAGVESFPSALIVGALGRCGTGAVDLFERCNLSFTPWDINETSMGGPFDAVRDHDILVNCVFVNDALPPFTTREHLQHPGRQLQVISDVSCDPFGQYNPLPVYSQCTSMSVPTDTIILASDTNPSLELVAIDHLPSLLPRESSEDFSSQLLSSLLKINALEQGVWKRAYDVFEHHLSRIE